MVHPDADSLIPDRDALMRRATELGCVEAVGSLALRRYQAGARLDAHAILRQRQRTAPSPALAELLAEEGLWVDPPPAGRVYRLRRSGVPDVLGHPVRTRWTRLFGVRFSPSGNFLVAGQPERVVAEVPITDAQLAAGSRRRRSVVVGLALAAMAASWLIQPTHVYVCNGFPVPIVVEMAGDDFVVPPYGAADRWTFRWRVRVAAWNEEGDLISEALITKGWGDPVVFDPGPAAVLAVEDVAYGGGALDEVEFLPREVLHSVSAHDVLQDPPATLEVRRGQSIHRTHVYNVLTDGSWENDLAKVAFIADRHGVDAALDWADVNLRFAPDQPELARFAEPPPGPDRLPYWTDLHLRAPQSVPLWRRWGELQRDPIAFELAARAEADRGNPVAQVVAALFVPDPAVALSYARQAPEAALGPAARCARAEALADASARLGRWAEAASGWEAVFACGAEPAVLARRERARVRRLGALPTPEEADPASLPEAQRLLEAELRAASGPAQAATELAATGTYADPREARLGLAIAAGDLAEARRVVESLARGPDAVGYALPVEAAAGDDARLGAVLEDDVEIDVGWARVAAAAAATLDLPSAARWEAAASADGDGGPALVDIRAQAGRPPTLRAWSAWAPRHWARASLAAAWVARGAGDLQASAGWIALARDAAVPGEMYLPVAEADG